jgi:uncharacterized membrane protein
VLLIVGGALYIFPNFGSLVLFGIPSLLGWVALLRIRSKEHHEADYELVLAFAGVCLLFLIEFIYLKEPAAPGRFNTYFKTYAQVWILLSVASGVIIGRFINSNESLSRYSLPGSTTRYLLVGILIISTSFYGIGVIHNWSTADSDGIRTPNNPTLDALEFAEDRHPARMAAIQWLGQKQGTPNIASAPGAYIWQGYHWVNAPSSLTGIPTVAGWSHEAGYRGSSTYWTRVDRVGLIFNGTKSDRYKNLRRYDVEYIYYGPVERDRYGVNLFSNETAVTTIFKNRAVTIFRVNHSKINK